MKLFYSVGVLLMLVPNNIAFPESDPAGALSLVAAQTLPDDIMICK